MSQAAGSILESIGSEIVGVMAPVSICMAAVVLLVFNSGSSGSTIRTAANLVYAEDPSDSLSQKLQGSVLNALVFVALIALVTFLLFVLYYYNFTAFLINYTRFASFLILASLGGSIVVSLLRRASLPLDAPSALLLILNLSALGTFSLFSPGFPLLLRQSYTVALGVISAVWLARLPEWTTWMLLLALAAYDLVAVLSPSGPLKLLVDLASTRGEDLPALVYESRPSPNVVATPRRSSPVIELQPARAEAEGDENDAERERERSPLVRSRSNSPVPDEISVVVADEEDDELVAEEERSPLVENESGRRPVVERERGIRLGLGDFVFYSVLVGRAAMYDLMTVYACYLAVISGLGCTLVLLSLYRRALPALPVSIALGVVFYFLTRLLVEPFVVGAATNLLMF